MTHNGECPSKWSYEYNTLKYKGDKMFNVSEYYRNKLKDPMYREHKNKIKNKWYQDNIEENRKKGRNYSKTPTGIYSTIKANAKKRGNDLKISREEFINWYKQQEQKCFYCDRSIKEIQKDIYFNRIKRLTVDRIDNNKGYEKDNLVLCCYRCNLIKSDFFTKNEMLKIGEIIKEKYK